MAAAHKVITVDLGTSTLKVAEFGISRGGALTLLRFGVAELGLDPNKEEERAKFITPTLAKLFKEHRIKGGEVLLSISGQSVFMRFVKLPPVDPAQVEQVVKFEAQQNVPFPIDEVTWDYQMMSVARTTGNEAEAVIVAIKKEVIQAEVEAVERVGVKIKQVDVAPFALLNAFRYSEPQTDDCALIIDMGARSTNLVFVEKNSFWIRNVPIAGNQISQSICNEMQEPFTAAEMMKKGKGFVSLGGVYADPDDADAARISKLIRSTMTRLHVDINRSIAYYRTTLGGGAPKRVFLTGGSSQLPYLDLFIADKLSLPVAYFNPLRNVNLDASLNRTYLQQNNLLHGGSGRPWLLRGQTGSCPAEVTLSTPRPSPPAPINAARNPYFFGACSSPGGAALCLPGPLLLPADVGGADQGHRSSRPTPRASETIAPKLGDPGQGAGRAPDRRIKSRRRPRRSARRLGEGLGRHQRQNSRRCLDHRTRSAFPKSPSHRAVRAAASAHPGTKLEAPSPTMSICWPHQRPLPRQRQDPRWSIPPGCAILSTPWH